MDKIQEEKKSYEENFKTLYSQLNSAQKLAVDSVEGPVMVIAGPGTGKTQILAMRIARILADPDLQVNPSNILCLTFTESATVAMRKRLISIIGPTAYQIRIHTFHSFCNDVIKENSDKFFFADQVTDLQKIQAMTSFIEALDVESPLKPFGDKFYYRKDLLSRIQTLKRESITPQNLMEITLELEKFLQINFDEISAFIKTHAKKIKDDDCNLFLEKIHIRNPKSPFATMFQDFRDQAESITKFKSKVKTFFENTLSDVPKHKELAKIYQQYQNFLASNKTYDFEDMILRVVNQFKIDSELLARYQEQFQYVLVDEYQDTNGAQNEVVSLLLSYYQENPNIFVVGDDDQSIFRFQGASLENIIRFYRLYKNHIRLIVLEENYRSHQNILDISSRIINANQTRITNLIPGISKVLRASLQHHKKEIEIIKTYDMNDEIFMIGHKIKSLIGSGVHPSEIAILYRENKHAIDLMDCFSRMEIPCAIEAGENILENPLIRRLTDLLRLICNPESNSDILFNVLNYDFVLESDYFKKNNITLRDVFDINLKRKLANKPGEQKLLLQCLLEDPRFSDWANKILSYYQQSFNLRLDDLVEKIIHDFGYMKYIFSSEDYLLHVSNLDSFFSELRSLIDSPPLSFAQSTLDKHKPLTLKDFIKYLELLFDSDLVIKSKTLISRANSVRLMTAHKSKGLEFEHVFIHACLEKVWKSKNYSKLRLPPTLINVTDALIEQDEDERRLFYVALTRSKSGLYLFYHMMNEKGQELTPCIFISELSKEKVVKHIDHTKVEDQEYYKSLEMEKLAYRFKPKSHLELIPEKDFIDSLLENYKMSITHLNNFLYCPRKFFYQNLLRVPSAKDRSSSFGTAVHASLCEMMKSFQNKKPSTDVEHQSMLNFLKQQFEISLDRERLAEKDHNDLLKHGLNVLEAYYNHYKSKLNPNVLLEYNFDAFGLHIEGIPITGKLDKIEILDQQNQTINVVDYKTGQYKNAKKKLSEGEDYHRQIVFYQLLCNLANATGLFKFKMKSGEIDFIQKNEDSFEKHSIVVSTEDLGNLKLIIQDTYKKIQAHDFQMTNDLDNCSACSFKNVCGR
jgi:DNA helicase-2/ATP-dependent DNA helicase PcrA